jgi:hypothetical protein
MSDDIDPIVILDRSFYMTEIGKSWSFAEGRVGIEVSDVQDSNANSEVAIHTACSIREFWIDIPGTDFEINVLVNGADIHLLLQGVNFVSGSQIGTDAEPYKREVVVSKHQEIEGESSATAGLDASATTEIGRLSILGKLGLNFGRRRSKKTKDVRSITTSKLFTRILYMTNGVWHARPFEGESGEEGFFFGGTIISDIICRVQGLSNYSTITAQVYSSPEYISTTTIRNRHTAEPLSVRVTPNDVDYRKDRETPLATYLRNDKLALLSIMIQKHKEKANRKILLGSHSMTLKRKN